MKRIISLCLSLCLILGGALLGRSTAFAEGGRQTVDFANAESVYNNFDFFTEAVGQGFFLSDGYLCSAGRVENKAVLKTQAPILDCVLEADFHKINDIAPIDAGFYIHASSATGKIDDITAYNVNLEKPIKSNTLTVKIHRFEGEYIGELIAVSLTVKSYPVKLKVIVKNENVKVHINNSKNPVIDYNLTSYTAGSVGFRAFRGTPAKIGNFKISSSSIPVDKSEINKMIESAKKITDLSIYTSESAKAFSNALKNAQNAIDSSQENVDIAVKELKIAMDNLLVKYSFEELGKKIESAKQIIAKGEGVYTQNTFNALKSVIARAEKLNESSSESEISKFVKLLNNSLNNLVKYK